MEAALLILREILRGAIRIEKKLDELMVGAKKTGLQTTPFHFKGQMCPLCARKVDYIPVQRKGSTVIDIFRVCGCVPHATQPVHDLTEET